MINKGRKLKFSAKMISKNSYYFAVHVWFFLCVLSETVLSEINFLTFIIKFGKVIVCFLLFCKIINQKYRKSEIIKSYIFMLIVGISTYLCNYTIIIWGGIFIISAKNIDIKKIALIYLRTVGSTVFIVVMLALFNIIENRTCYVYELYGLSIRKIFMYGFLHHNFVGGRVFWCYLCYLFVKFNEIKIKDYFIGIILFCVEFYLFISKTSAVLILISMGLIFIIKRIMHLTSEQRKNLILNISYLVISFSIIFSICLSIKYDINNRLHIFINNLISIRFSSAHNLLNEYGVSIWGQKLNLISSLEAEKWKVKAIILDNAYMHLIIRCGIVYMLFLFWGYFKAVGEAVKNNKYDIVVVVLIIFMCGISEKWLFMISYNPFLILIAYWIFEYPRIFEEKRNIIGE